MAKSALMMALLAGAALALPVTPAAAQSKPDDSGPSDKSKTSTRTTVEEVTVTSSRKNRGTGGGLITPQVAPQSISTVSSAYIQTQAAIQNAYQYIALTPGALVSTADPFGLSTQFSINVRGLGQDELGYVLEGMPLNDIGYYTAYPSQFIDSENIDQVALEQGSVDLDSPVISAAGGLLKLFALDPSVRPGGSVDVSYGSYDTKRAFIRLDTGLIGNTGIRAFGSYSHTDSDQWRGAGTVHRDHADFKIVKEWDNGSRATLTANVHNGVTPNYLNPHLSDFLTQGDKYNYDKSFTPGDGNYWKLNVGTFRIVYLTAPSKWVVNDNLTVDVTPYYQYGYGNGPFGTTLTTNGNCEGNCTGPVFSINIPNGAANGNIVQADFQDLQYRAGVIGKLSYTTGFNTFIAGFWQDYSDETDTQTLTGVSADGAPFSLWGDKSSAHILKPDGQPYLLGQDHVTTSTEEPFIADVVNLLDKKLRIEAGFKYAFIHREGSNGVPSSQHRTVIDNSEPLPRLSVRYQFNPEHQVFASVTTNFRTPSEATLFDGYFPNGDGTAYQYQAVNPNLKPEYSTEEEVGYRYSGSYLTGSLTFFNYYFTDRQITSLGGASGNVNQSTNAGAQTTRGIDFELGGKRWHFISPYLSAEYLSSTIDSNLPVVTTDGLGNPVNDFLPTKGKTSIRSPKYQIGLGLSYDDGTFFGNLGVKRVDRQFSTQLNDESIPAYTTVDLGFGARLPSIGLRARPELKLNLINLNNGAYLSGVASPTLNATTTTGINGNTIAGSAPKYYESAGIAAIFTFTQAF